MYPAVLVILTGQLLPCRVPNECPQEIADLLASCLLADPAERPSAAQIVVLLREHLGTARQPLLPLKMPHSRLQWSSDSSSSMDRLAEQMSIRGAEAVQLRARHLGTRVSLDIGDHANGEDRLSVRGYTSLPGAQDGASPTLEDAIQMRISRGVRTPDSSDAFEEALNVFQRQGIMASPFEEQLSEPLF